MVTSKIAQHHHCRGCGKAFVGEDVYCSEDCRSENQERIKKKKRQLLILYAISFIVLIAAVVYTTL